MTLMSPKISLAALTVTGLIATLVEARPGCAADRGPCRLTLAAQQEMKMQQKPYVGMWVTPNGHIRHELLPNGRYDEARGQRQSAYQGRYEINGSHIDYWDDTGFTADGEFVDENTLHHGGMIFHRER